MSYTKLHTPALVLSGHNVGESSRLYSLFTKEFGMVHAKAQGVREIKSRHRFALQTLSMADVSLVKGKYGWRITNTMPQSSLYTAFTDDFHKRKIVLRVAQLLKRLVQGEQPDEVLYATVSNAVHFLQNETLEREAITHLEILIVLRMLHILGYLKQEDTFDPLLTNLESFSHTDLEYLRTIRPKAILTINTAIKATQL